MSNTPYDPFALLQLEEDPVRERRTQFLGRETQGFRNLVLRLGRLMKSEEELFLFAKNFNPAFQSSEQEWLVVERVGFIGFKESRILATFHWNTGPISGLRAAVAFLAWSRFTQRAADGVRIRHYLLLRVNHPTNAPRFIDAETCEVFTFAKNAVEVAA